jgi:sugar lactone lactonase YvrE
MVIGDSPGIVRIVAGVPDSAGDRLGERATETLLNAPRGVAISEAGVVYIADHENERLLAVASSGRVDILVDGRGQAEGPRLQGPDGLFLAGELLLIADPKGHRIWQLELTSGKLTPIAGTGLRGFSADSIDPLQADLDTPTGVLRTPDERLCFSELFAHRVRCIEPDGMLVTLAGDGVAGSVGDGGPARQARLRRPAGIAEADGVLYIADSGNNRIRAVVLETSVIWTVAGVGVAGFGGDGDLAVEALLDTPLAVALSPDRRLVFIADSQNHRIRTVNLETLTISTYAGTGGQTFQEDLLAAGETALSQPTAVAVSPAGFLYISDTGHHIVRRCAIVFVALP